MSKARGKRDPQPRLRIFGLGPFTLITDEVRSSVAYLSLTPIARLVLIDMIGHYNLVSKHDSERLPNGFQYVYQVCKEPVSHNAFYKAVNEIVDRGFFRRPLNIQPSAIARPTRYVPSPEWRQWALPTAVQKVNKRKARKASRLESENKRRVDKLRQNAVPKNGGITSPENGGIKLDRN